jgi:hypothetical protein
LGSGSSSKETPQVTEKEALIFDKNGKAVYANGQLLGPTLDDAASKAAAGYNWAALKADINTGKIKGTDLDKVYANMARTILGAIKMTDPTKRDEYASAIVTYLKDVANAPVADAAGAGGKPAAKPSVGEVVAADAAAAKAAGQAGPPTGVNTTDVNGMELSIWNFANALKKLGTVNDAEKKQIDEYVKSVEKEGVSDYLPWMMEQLKKIAKRNNYSF